MTAPIGDASWYRLREEALAASRRAYAPFSGLRVGAAGLTRARRIVRGCNVENASFGLTLCAECGLVSELCSGHDADEHDRLLAVAVRSSEGAVLAPCGRCRQLLMEHGGPALLVDADPAPVPLGRLLPEAFTAADLPVS